MRLSRSHIRSDGIVLVLLLLILPVGITGRGEVRTAGPTDRVALSTRARYLMGTTLTINLPVSQDAPILESVFAEVDRLEEVLSNWSPSSEITLLNQRAATGPVVCSIDLFEAIATALRWAEVTSGAFDPTIEPLVRQLGLRGTAPTNGQAEPSRDGGQRTSRLLATVGWEHVLLDARRRTARFDASGVGIDLGGIGKGIALDAAARVVKEAGFEAALLDFGGQVLAIGESTAGGPWRVGIADPVERHDALGWVALENGSLATSGNAERSVAGSDGPTGHLLDPATGKPSSFQGSVTVLAPDATTADALSTALFVMGPETGLPWAEEHGVAALYISPDGMGRYHRWATRSLREVHWFEEAVGEHGAAPRAGSAPPADGRSVRGSVVQ
jgi:thiamine biosynthesis lipoprotein